MTAASVTSLARIDELVDEARRTTGLENFGGDTWRVGLEVLVASALSEATLNDVGERMFYGGILRSLVNRLRIEDWYTRYPEINDEVAYVELLGVGFPRTGSTALAHVLAEDDNVRVLRMWEAMDPCPPPGVSPEDDDARIAAAKASVAASDGLSERLRSMVPQSATGAHEDHDLLSLEFTSQVFLPSAWIPSYAKWLVDCDMEPTYRYERRVLQLLQWRCPPTRWQLKSPTHTLFLDAFETVFPEARFVMTHRDVASVLPSVSDLYAVILRMGNEGIDARAVGALNMGQWGPAIDRLLAFRDAGRDDKFYDIAFRDFQTDPIAEVRGLYRWLGRELSPEIEQRMRAWWDANPRDQHGSHEYDAAEYGFAEAVLAERFGAYRARFGPLLR